MIEEFLNSKKMRNKAANTLNNYRRDLTKFEGYIADKGISLNNINDTIVQQYINHLMHNKYAPSTINRMYAAIRSFCHYSDQLDAVEDIDIQRVPHISKQESKGLSLKEVDKIRLSISNNKKDANKLRNLAIFDCLVFTGMRVSELVRLDKDSIIKTTYADENSGNNKTTYQLNITESKANETRKVYLSASKFKKIRQYLESRNDDNPALFISSRGRISVRMIQAMLQEYEIHPHMLRHTNLSRLARTNVDIVSIAALSGHKDINTVRRYTNPTAYELAQANDEAFPD